jgi:hypothetical protein
MEDKLITRQQDFSDTPEGWARYWAVEMDASKKFMEPWHISAKVGLDEYMDCEANEGRKNRQKANLFWANVTTGKAMVYGRMPQSEVSRRYDDPNDQEARIAGPVILQRLLNTDIEREDDGFQRALRHALCDYFIVGFASARVRYVAEFDDVPASADGKAAAHRKKRQGEDVATDYIYWEDQRWSPCRVFEDMRWWAYRTLMDKDAMAHRFGEEVAARVSFGTQLLGGNEEGNGPHQLDPWSRCEVWEIWSKQHKKVFWYVEGYGHILDSRDDPYGLSGFWPFPEFMIANLTTTKLLPRTDYAMAQDLYQDVNTLSSRISCLERALKVAGVYDSQCGDLSKLMNESGENVLLPVNWGPISEKGGLAAVIDWMPMKEIAETLAQLRDQRAEAKQLLYEVTGWADLMRGQLQDAGETATASRGKMRYGSVRLQHTMDEFARLATGLQRLKAELVTKLFDEATILKRSNVLRTADAAEAIQAVRMLKEEFPSYRIVIRPEALAQQDFSASQNERTQFVTALATLLRDAAPAMQTLGPSAAPVLIDLIKWTLAAFKGGATIEGRLDKALAQAEQAAQSGQGQQQPPDPKVVATQMKAQADMQRVQMKTQADIQKMQMGVETDRQRQENQLRYNVAEQEMKLRAKARAQAQEAAAKATAAAKRPEELL